MGGLWLVRHRYQDLLTVLVRTCSCKWTAFDSRWLTNWDTIQHLPGGWDCRKSQAVSIMTTHDLDGHLPKTISPHSTHTHVNGEHYGCSLVFLLYRKRTNNGHMDSFPNSNCQGPKYVSGHNLQVGHPRCFNSNNI